LRRERELVLRGFARLAAGFFATDFLAVVVREAPPVDDLARVLLAFFAVLRLALEPLAADFRAPLLRLGAEDGFDVPPELALALPSIVHLPVMTR
jgi:hypothetical protein